MIGRNKAANMRDILYRQLQPVRQRQWAVGVVRAAVWGLGGGSVAAAILGVLRLSGMLTSGGVGWGLLLGLPIVVAVSAAVWSSLKVDWLPAARAIDGHYELKDRTETALAFLRREQTGQADELQQLQLADAVQHLQRVEAKQVVPFVLPSSFHWAVVTTALAIVLLCWPTGRSQVFFDDLRLGDDRIQRLRRTRVDLRTSRRPTEQHDRQRRRDDSPAEGTRQDERHDLFRFDSLQVLHGVRELQLLQLIGLSRLLASQESQRGLGAVLQLVMPINRARRRQPIRFQ